MSKVRDNGKPNTAALHRGKVTFFLAGMAGHCTYCGLGITWSREAADVKAPGWGTFGHGLPESQGGTWQGNTAPECWTCQTDAKTLDKRGDESRPTPARWVSAKVAGEYARTFLADAGLCPPARTLPGVKARRAARAARGLKW